MLGSDLPARRTQKPIADILIRLANSIRKHSRIMRPLLEADLAALERRLAATQSLDLHREAAALAYEIPVEDVTPEQRAVGKILNFAILYEAPLESILRQHIRSPRRKPCSKISK